MISKFTNCTKSGRASLPSVTEWSPSSLSLPRVILFIKAEWRIHHHRMFEKGTECADENHWRLLGLSPPLPFFPFSPQPLPFFMCHCLSLSLSLTLCISFHLALPSTLFSPLFLLLHFLVWINTFSTSLVKPAKGQALRSMLGLEDGLDRTWPSQAWVSWYRQTREYMESLSFCPLLSHLPSSSTELQWQWLCTCCVSGLSWEPTYASDSRCCGVRIAIPVPAVVSSGLCTLQVVPTCWMSDIKP